MIHKTSARSQDKTTALLCIAAALLLLGLQQSLSIVPSLLDLQHGEQSSATRGAIVSAWLAAINVGAIMGPIASTAAYGAMNFANICWLLVVLAASCALLLFSNVLRVGHLRSAH